MDSNVNRVNPARVHNYLLGGKDNSFVDRDAAHQLLTDFPETLDAIRGGRCFLQRAVRWLAHSGVTQFVELGCGMPVGPAVHDIARQSRPEARVVYVDHDPVVLAHARALLATDDHTGVLARDVTHPGILTEAYARGLLEPAAPTALLCISVGHLITDDAALRRILTDTTAAAPPGSYIAFTQLTATTRTATTEFRTSGERVGMPLVARTPGSIRDMLGEHRLVPPGLGEVDAWRPGAGRCRWPHVHPQLRRFVGAGAATHRIVSYGAVLQSTAQPEESENP